MVVKLQAPPAPVVWDIATDYKEVEGRFYARSDIDHKVYIRDDQAVWVNPDTGEMKIARR